MGTLLCQDRGLQFIDVGGWLEYGVCERSEHKLEAIDEMIANATFLRLAEVRNGTSTNSLACRCFSVLAGRLELLLCFCCYSYIFAP